MPRTPAFQPTASLFSDGLLSMATAPDQTPANRLKAVQTFGRAATWLLQNEQFSVQTPKSSLRLALTVACLPSIERLATGRPHSKEVARNVTRRIIAHYQQLSDAELRPYAVPKPDEPPQAGEIRGHLSELAILMLLSQGATRGFRDPRSFMLPTLTSQDNAKKQDGKYAGIDFVLTEPERETRINSKSGVSPHALDKAENYIPGVVILRPRDVAHAGPSSSVILLDGLVANDVALLDRANREANYIIERDRSDTVQHDLAALALVA